MEENNEGLKEKKSNGNIVIISILLLLVFALFGYIVYDKVFSKESNNKSNGSATPTLTPEATRLPEWVTYLLSQNITSIKYGYAEYDNDANFVCKEKDVTKEDLERILDKMTAFDLKKHDAGGAGSDCNNEGFTIKYGNNKTLYIFRGRWITIDDRLDSELKALIEKDVDIDEPVTNSDPWLVYDYYQFDTSYINMILRIE